MNFISVLINKKGEPGKPEHFVTLTTSLNKTSMEENFGHILIIGEAKISEDNSTIIKAIKFKD